MFRISSAASALLAAGLLAALAVPASAMCFGTGSVTHCMDQGRSSTYQQQGRTTYSQGYDASGGGTWAEVERQNRYGDRRVRRYVDGQPAPRYGYGDRRFDYGGSETWYVGP